MSRKYKFRYNESRKFNKSTSTASLMLAPSGGGRWEGADPQYVDGMSDNFKAFKDAKLANKTPEQAAFETWTGKQAQKQGFTKAKVITDNNNLIIVEFTK
jgi:hypothetical protein